MRTATPWRAQRTWSGIGPPGACPGDNDIFQADTNNVSAI